MCGCERRRERLNRWHPGAGDMVASVAEPVKGAYMKLLKPDAVAVMGFIAGAFIVPVILAWVQRRA